MRIDIYLLKFVAIDFYVRESRFYGVVGINLKQTTTGTCGHPENEEYSIYCDRVKCQSSGCSLKTHYISRSLMVAKQNAEEIERNELAT